MHLQSSNDQDMSDFVIYGEDQTLTAIFKGDFFTGVLVHESSGEVEFKDGAIVSILDYSDVVFH